MSNIVRIDDDSGKPHYYDFGTKNSSFLLTAKELKDLGYKNYYFMLEVRHPEFVVQDMDPYNSDITADDIGKILIECKHNPWYFFREVTRIPVRGAGTQPLYLHRGGCAAIWCFIHSLDFELVQPRQTFKTTVITAIMSYAMLFEYRNADIPYMHKTEKRCTDNVGILRDYIMALPKYMNPWANAKHPPGLQSLKYEQHNVNIAVVSAAKSENAATDKSRGFSLFCWFVDECEFIPYMKAVIDGANPTIVQARATAKQLGVRSCMIYASTPGDLETDEGKDFQKIIDNTPVFNESFYDLSDDEIEHMKTVPNPDDEDRDRIPINMVYIEFNYIQLRKDGKWLSEQYYEAVKKGTLGEYRRGVLLQRFRGGQGSFFRQSDIDYIQQHIRQHDYDIFLLQKYHLYVYKHEIRRPDLTSDTPYFDIDIPYLIGIDCGTGKNGDNTAICIVHPYTLEVVGEFLSPVIGILDLMRVITTLAQMLPKALFCLESNMTGVDIIDFVQESQLENRFYHDPRASELTKNVIEPQHPKMSLTRKAEAKKHFGTYVTVKTRKMMFNILRDMVSDYRHLIYTEYLVKDICNLVEQKNGNMAAASGEHDDLVMAYLHTLYVLKYGYQLGRFGIDKSLCTYDVSKQIMDQYEQATLENTVDNLSDVIDDPNSFEGQLIRDMTIKHDNDVIDEYGYSHNQYNTGYNNMNNEISLSQSDLNFFREINSMLLD